MVADSISDNNGNENDNGSNDQYPEKNFDNSATASLFYYGTHMCQLLDKLYDSLTFVENKNIKQVRVAYVIGFEEAFKILNRLKEIQKSFVAVAQKMSETD